jgi:hypothetical protein
MAQVTETVIEKIDEAIDEEAEEEGEGESWQTEMKSQLDRIEKLLRHRQKKQSGKNDPTPQSPKLSKKEQARQKRLRKFQS